MASIKELRKAILGDMSETPLVLPSTEDLENDPLGIKWREEQELEIEQEREQERLDYMLSQMPNSQKLNLFRDIELEKESAYFDLLYKYQLQYGVNNDNRLKNSSDIRNIAEKISPYYKKYKLNPEKLNLTSDEWANIHAHYDAYKETYGEDQANAYLNNAIKNNIASNQAWYELACNGFLGMGASAYGAITGAIGNIRGAYDYFAGNYLDVPGLGGWDNFLNSVLDNDTTRYANDVLEYGTILPEEIEKAKSYGTDFSPHGLSKLEIIQSQDLENSLFSSATPWVALLSGGFTVASMFTGWGEAKLASMIFGGLSKGAVWANRVSLGSKIFANTLGKAVKTEKLLDKTLTALKKANNIVDRYVIPGSVGTIEGAMEGLLTKMQIEEEQSKYLDDYYNSKINKIVQLKLKDPDNTKTEEELIREIWDEYSDEYMQSKDLIAYAATKAGINNFYINSFINGAINSTLKAGLLSDKVQNALKNGKLTGWAFSRPKWLISNAGTSVATAEAITSRGGKAWSFIKEPLGEAFEEYLQTLSNDINVGAAENNIHKFIENKFNGDGTAVVGDWFGSDWAAAWTALKGSVTSKEAMQSAIMGALSSAMGTLVAPGRKKVKNKKTGEIETQSIFNPTNLTRGVNEKGERESTWEYIKRITPWRSGIYANYNDFLKEKERKEEEAEALTLWLKDPRNRDKLNSVVGTILWAMEKENFSRTNDEFGYRNSALGKDINDAIMLQKIADSNLGNAIMEQLNEIADMTADSLEAKAYIAHMKNNVNINTEGKTDEQIFEQLQKNILKLRSTISAILKESEKIDKLIGNVDDDTRQSLIYGLMMLDDWSKRLPELESEILRIKIQASVGMSNAVYSNKEKKLIAKHGSLKAAIARMHDLNERRIALEKQIDTIEKLGDNATTGEKITLNRAKAQIKLIGKQLKEYDSLSENALSDIVLNEQEIMELDTSTRGRMLRLGALKLYASLHEDKETINSLTTQIHQLEKQIGKEKAKSTKGGKANKKKAATIKKLSTELNLLRKELKEYKSETRLFYSEELLAVIDNLILQGMALDADFLDKVVDAGRMEASIKAFYAQRQAILTDPNAYQNYVKAIKVNALLERTRIRAGIIEEIKDYAEFAKEMDKILTNSSFVEQDIIQRTLRESGNENWEKYKQKRKNAESLLDTVIHSELSSTLTPNDLSIFMHTLNYLLNEDVDLFNIDQVVSALTETSENGDFAFRRYVEEMNDSHPELTKTVFTSIGSVIQTYKEAMLHKLKQDAETALIERKVAIEDTEPASTTPKIAEAPKNSEDKPLDTPPLAPKPKPLWEVAYNNAEGGQVDEAGQRLDVPRPFEVVGNKEIADMAEIAIHIINSNSYPQEIKEAALLLFMTLSNPETYHYNTVEDLIDTINSLSNTIKSLIDEGNNNKAISAILDKIANALTRQNIQSTSTEKNLLFNPLTNPNAATLITALIEFIRKNYPDSWIVDFYEQYGIEDFIRNHTFNINTPIYFMTDSSLTAQEMKLLKEKYRNSMKPIIAVIESENGPIEIEGKRYLPIGVMPYTGTQMSGSNRLAIIRELSSPEEGIHIVRNKDGSPTVSRAKGQAGAVIAHHPNLDKKNSEAFNRPVQQLIVETLPKEELLRLNAMPFLERIKDPLYQSAKDKFITGLLTLKRNGKDLLFFKPNNLKDDGGSPSIILTKAVGTSFGRNGMTLQQADQSNNPNDLIFFNSITKALYNRVIQAVQKLIPDLNSESDPSEFTQTETKIASLLNSNVLNFIYFGKSGYSFNVSFDAEKAQQTGEIVFNITLDNTDESKPQIQVGLISRTSDILAFGKEFISKLLMNNGEINSFVKWQIDYGEVKILRGEKQGDKEKAKNHLSEYIDDGILDIATNALQYIPTAIQLESPYDNDNVPRNFPPIVANADNATTPNLGDKPTVTSTTTTPNRVVVDTNTGLPIEGTPTQQLSPALLNARKIANAVVKDSKRIKLSSDGKYYELFDDEGNVIKRFVRVTSFILSDVHGEVFDENSPYVTPSTNIGTGFDILVRDFFNNRFYKLGDTWCSANSYSEGTEIFLEKLYPNATRELLNAFLDLLQLFKNSLDTKGITIISNDVTVTGTVTVTDDKELLHKVPVAGTLDLFGYDALGNFFIFDMKTVHDLNKKKLLDKKLKWARQVSLYKDLLELSYGIKIPEGNLKVIPISVTYPNPIGSENGTADYSVAEPRLYDTPQNQLMINGKKFVDAHPKMLGTTYEELMTLPYTPLNVNYDTLSDEEKAIIEAEIEGASPKKIKSGEKPQRLDFEDPDLSELDDLPPITEDNKFTPPDIPAEEGLDYSKFTNELKSMLRKKGIKNSKDWNNLTSEEQKRYKGCL